MDWNDYSNPEIVRLLGQRYREYRLRVGLTQKEVAEKSNVTATTIHKFETGVSTDISFSTLASLLRAIGLIENVDGLLPDLFPSPYLVTEKNERKQRVRHKKS